MRGKAARSRSLSLRERVRVRVKIAQSSPLSLRERVRVREKAQHCPTPATPAVTGLPPFNLSAMTQPKERLLTVQRGRWCGLFIAERRKDFRTSRQEVGASEGPRQGRRAAEILKTRRHRAAAMKGASSPGSRGAAYGAPLSVAPSRRAETAGSLWRTKPS